MSNFTIYSSSAGSGKTFTLTKEYLKLILSRDNPLYFQKVLAVTFTNDAAKEMKERIVSALKEIKASKGELLKILIQELSPINEEDIVQRAAKAHYEILQNYNDFAVKTIDSFVNQIVSTFTFDLNLPYNYEIVLDTSELVDEAVKNLLNRVGESEELSAMFTDFALSKVEEDKSWNSLETDISSYANKNIFEQNYAELIELNIGVSHEEALEIRKKINSYCKNLENEVKTLAQKASQIISENGILIEDFSYGSSGIGAFFQKLSESPEELLTRNSKMPNSRVLAALYEDKWYGSKSAKARQIDHIKAELNEIGIQILSLKDEKYSILKSIDKDLLKIPFLALIKTELNKILTEKNQVVLADFNRKILEVVSREPVPYIYERIGEKYNHFLIDEFQDTADIQFFNLIPLLENALSKNFYNLMVGDPKQAIYSWRGGNVRLMLDLIQSSKEYLGKKVSELQQSQLDGIINNVAVKNLNINFRSREEIVHFNNQLFKNIVEGLESENAKNVFSDYFQYCPEKPKKDGFVSVSVLNKETDDWTEKLLNLIPEILEDGYALSDITILCRRGKEGIEVAELLRKAGYAIKSTEVLKLKNCIEIKFLVSALKFFSKPGEMFEKFEFLEFFFILKNIDSSDFELRKICGKSKNEFLEFLLTFGIDIRESDGLSSYELCEYLIDRFSLFDNKNAHSYLFAFLDFALDFSLKNPKQLSDFLAVWELKKEKLSVASNIGNAIEISTIHKSKGLQYKIVIIPFLNWNTEPNNRDKVWIKLNELNYAELDSGVSRIHAAPFSFAEKFTFNQDILSQERDFLFIENLNILYVALTRAVDRQYLWIWGKETAKGGLKIDGLGQYLYGFAFKNPDVLEVQFGQKSKKILETETAAIPEEILNIPKTFIKDAELKISHVDRNEQQEEGKLIHTAFERISIAEDTENALAFLLENDLISETETPELKHKIEAVIKHPELHFLFSKDVKIKNELEILSSHSPVKRPDRLIFRGSEVYVLDYKTGQKSSSHRQQLKEYKNLLLQMGYKDVKALLVYLDPLEVIKIQ